MVCILRKNQLHLYRNLSSYFAIRLISSPGIHSFEISRRVLQLVPDVSIHHTGLTAKYRGVQEDTRIPPVIYVPRWLEDLQT